MWLIESKSKALKSFWRYSLASISILIFYQAADGGSVLAQDLSAPDSVKLVLKVAPLIGKNLSMTVECSVFVDANTNQILQLGWKWTNPSLQMDSAQASPQFGEMDVGPFFFLGDDISITNDSQVAICSGICTFNCYPPASGWRQLATYYLHSPGWTANSAVEIDSIQLPGHYMPSTEFIFLPLVGNEYDPVWAGPIRFAGCCVGIRGDANLDGVDANILDLNYLVNFIFRGGAASPCPQEANVYPIGNTVNILDLNFLVNRIFRNGPAPAAC